MVAFMTENLSQIIRQIGDPIARALGLEILDIQCTGKPINTLVRLTLDKNGGVGIDDCEQFHHLFVAHGILLNLQGRLVVLRSLPQD